MKRTRRSSSVPSPTLTRRKMRGLDLKLRLNKSRGIARLSASSRQISEKK
jgi:hypothetical protein